MPILLSNGAHLKALDYGSIRSDPLLAQSNAEFLKSSRPVQDSKRCLYVGQRECASVLASDPFIDIVGSDDSTTCHVVALVDQDNGNCSLSHFDGSDTRSAVEMMIESLEGLNRSPPSARDRIYSLFMIGGFLDERNSSAEISHELIETFANMKHLFHLKLCIITELNDTVRNGVHFPVVYGLGFDVKRGEAFMCNRFVEKGPDMAVRGARHFSTNGTMHIYDPVKYQLTIGPFTYKPITFVKEYMKLPGDYLLKYFSTSPEQEPEHFIENLRASFNAMVEHPKPLETYFKASKAKVYSKQPDGSWALVT